MAFNFSSNIMILLNPMNLTKPIFFNKIIFLVMKTSTMFPIPLKSFPQDEFCAIFGKVCEEEGNYFVSNGIIDHDWEPT